MSLNVSEACSRFSGLRRLALWVAGFGLPRKKTPKLDQVDET